MGVLAEHIFKTFSTTEVLHDISFSIQNGEVVGLLGPNGAGKTTLMRILLGLLSPDNKKEVKTILQCPPIKGYLSETNPLYETMYVREYLSFMMDLTYKLSRKERRDKVEELIERVGLKNETNKPIKELSKGYHQRVGLAQAIMSDPELLILDEPTTGLDPNQVIEIRSLIRNMVSLDTYRPKVVILSTHLLHEVKEMCSRVLILDHGYIKIDKRIEEIDDLNDLFETVTHE